MKVLLAIDGSDHGEGAAEEVARQRLPAGSEVRVISVVETPYLPVGFQGEGLNMPLYAELETVARNRARAAVDTAQPHFEPMKGVGNSTSRRLSSPARRRDSSSKKPKPSARI